MEENEKPTNEVVDQVPKSELFGLEELKPIEVVDDAKKEIESGEEGGKGDKGGGDKEIEDRKKEIKEEVKIEEPIKPKEITDDVVLAYLQKQGRDVKSVDSLFQKNEWEDLLSDEDKAYYNFKKETNGRSRKEFDALNEDVSGKTPLQWSIEKLKKETGLGEITNDQAKEYLEESLNIDLGEDTISTKIALSKYSKEYKDKELALKEQYRTPLASTIKEELVTLDNGEQMEKSKYEKLVKDYEAQVSIRNKYLGDIKTAVDSVAAYDFKVKIGDGEEADFTYEPTKEDKHSMLSDSSDIDSTVQKRYQTKEGFNHQGLVNDFGFWGKEENRQKVIEAAVKYGHAMAISNKVASDNNENFSPNKPIPKNDKVPEGYVTPNEALRTY